MHADLPSGLHHDSNRTRVRLGHVLHVKKKQLLLQGWAWSRIPCLAPVPRIPPHAHTQLPLADM